MNKVSPTNRANVVAKTGGTGGPEAVAYGIDISVNSPPPIRVQITQSNGSNVSVTASTVLESNKWYYVTLVADGSNLVL